MTERRDFILLNQRKIMNQKSMKLILLFSIFLISCGSGSNKQGIKDKDKVKIEFVTNDSEKKIDVIADGKLFTSYRWHDPVVLDIKKPLLYPIIASSGTEITRGYPLNPRPGERVDHPENPGHPTYWHARGYGLLLANPLGAGAYTNGQNVMNFSIPAGKSATFRFRLIVNSGADLTDNEINTYAEDFAGKY